MNSKKIKNVLIVIFFFMCLMLFSFAIIKFKNSTFDFITYLSSCSSFFVAILTILYVFTTTKQIDLMGNQLSEMKKERELQGQPLPWLESLNVQINQPKLYFSPFEGHSFISIYSFTANIKNISDSPAICIDVSASILITTQDGDVYLDSPSIRVSALEGKSTSRKIELVYVDDSKALFYEAIRQKKLKYEPILLIKIVYRNMSGGYFLYTNKYRIINTNKDKELTVTDWHKQIISFPIEYKEKIEKLSNLRNKDEEKWRVQFDDLRSEIACGLSEESIELFLYPEHRGFNIKSITKDEYDKYTENINYGKQFNKTTICRE